MDWAEKRFAPSFSFLSLARPKQRRVRGAAPPAPAPTAPAVPGCAEATDETSEERRIHLGRLRAPGRDGARGGHATENRAAADPGGRAATPTQVTRRGDGEARWVVGRPLVAIERRGRVGIEPIREETRGGHGGHGAHRELLKLEREAGEGAGSEARLLVCLNGSGEGYI